MDENTKVDGTLEVKEEAKETSENTGTDVKEEAKFTQEEVNRIVQEALDYINIVNKDKTCTT